MTILQALASYHDRFIAKGETHDYGFSNERISYAIVLSPESGKAVDVVPLLDTSGKKPRPLLYKVPQPVKRTSGIASNFLWDKTAYALGIKRDSRTKQAVPAEREHAAFKKLHEDMLNGADDEGLQALLRFMDGWRREAYDSLPHFRRNAGHKCRIPAGRRAAPASRTARCQNDMGELSGRTARRGRRMPRHRRPRPHQAPAIRP